LQKARPVRGGGKNKKMKSFNNSQAEKFYNEYLKLDGFKKLTVRYILRRKQRHKFHIVSPSP